MLSRHNASFSTPAPQSANRLLAATWETALPAAGYQYSVLKFNGECCVSEIERLAEEGRRQGAKAVVGCGGGKVGVALGLLYGRCA